MIVTTAINHNRVCKPIEVRIIKCQAILAILLDTKTTSTTTEKSGKRHKENLALETLPETVTWILFLKKGMVNIVTEVSFS